LNDILDYSSNSHKEIILEVIDFPNLIKETFEELQFMENAQKLELLTVYQLEGTFYSDPKRLQIVFRNLISNSIKYQASKKEKSFLKIEINQKAEGALLIFEDNGIGIADDMKDKVFKMFFKASERSIGSGIGLYIVKEAVEKLGGDINLHSEIGKGSQFKIFIQNQNAQTKFNNS
ncbi:MAG: HAMP domain-containing sensor histidine kinase, partial [Bacteroidota bacterium]